MSQHGNDLPITAASPRPVGGDGRAARVGWTARRY